MDKWDFGQCCVICGSPYVQMHHIFMGTANRKVADRYGYVIPLCQPHHTGSKGIHFDRDLSLTWKRRAQEHFEANYGTRKDFIKEFGRNYLDE